MQALACDILFQATHLLNQAILLPQQLFHMRRQDVLSCLFNESKEHQSVWDVDAHRLLAQCYKLITENLVSSCSCAAECQIILGLKHHVQLYNYADL